MVTIILYTVLWILCLVALSIVLFRKKIRKVLNNLSIKLQLSTLRKSIHDADANKEKNDRKNIVVFNSVSKQFEPIEKRTLKNISKKDSRSHNAANTKYRKRNKPAGKRLMQNERVKTIENKSLYVTR